MANHKPNSGSFRKGEHASKDTEFKPGHVPWSKGKKITEYCFGERLKAVKKTMFTKGHVPHNAAPVGTKIRRESGWWVKTAEPKTWEPVARRLYRKAHGAIPEGALIITKNGDRDDLRPENLARVTRSENAIINRHGKGLPWEAKQAVIKQKTLKRLLNEKQNRRSQ